MNFMNITALSSYKIQYSIANGEHNFVTPKTPLSDNHQRVKHLDPRRQGVIIVKALGDLFDADSSC